MIDARTKTLALIGQPVSHSLSPHLHGFVLKALDLNCCYHAFDVNPRALARAVEGIKALGILGVNVTIPHKVAVIPYLDEVDDQAQKTGAVNTILNRDGRLVGFDTDGAGFRRSLASFEESVRGEKAVVLGAGGAARAVVYSLVEMGVNEIALYNRSTVRAASLTTEVRDKTGFPRLSAHGLDDDRQGEDLKNARILVNATSVGMFPDVSSVPLSSTDAIHSDLIVYDLVYNPLETALLRQAKDRGAQTIGGLDMLIFQGLESLRIWTDRQVGEDGDLVKRLKNHLISKLTEHE